MGNLTRDPEVRYLQNGTAVADICLAISRKYKVNNETKEETTFVDCTVWAKTAEAVGQYAKKGDPIFAAGRLQTESWDDKQTGQKRTKLKVIAETIQFLSRRESSDQPTSKPFSKPLPPEGQTRPTQGGRKPSLPSQDVGGSEWADEQIPFNKPHYIEVGGW